MCLIRRFEISYFFHLPGDKSLQLVTKVIEKSVNFFWARQPLVGQGLLVVEASSSHSDTSNSVGPFRTSDQSVAETTEFCQLQKKIARNLASLNCGKGEGIDFTHNLYMLIQACTNFPKIEKPVQNSARQNSDVKQDPYGGPRILGATV
jgi:hypothetical protein